MGDVKTVMARLSALIDETQADEVMITTMVYGVEQRRRTYELLADAFGLAGNGITPAPELALATA